MGKGAAAAVCIVQSPPNVSICVGECVALGCQPGSGGHQQWGTSQSHLNTIFILLSFLFIHLDDWQSPGKAGEG